MGIRPGEKVHEEMITVSDSFTTYDLGKYYVILPQVPNWKLNDYVEHFNAKLVPASLIIHPEPTIAGKQWSHFILNWLWLCGTNLQSHLSEQTYYTIRETVY